MPNEKLIRQVQKLSKELGRTPKRDEYNDIYKDFGKIKSRFKTWSNFVSQAGLKSYYESINDLNIACKVENCSTQAKWKGYCQKHYYQNLRYGQTKERTTFTPNKIKVIEDYAIITTYDINSNEKGYIFIDKDNVSKVVNLKIHTSEGYPNILLENKKISLVKFIFGKLKDGQLYSYKNKNPLDCREINVMIISTTELRRNSNIPRKSKTGVKGVRLVKGKYVAEIGHNHKKYYLGSYDTLDEARQARIEGEKQYWGKAYTSDSAVNGLSPDEELIKEAQVLANKLGRAPYAKEFKDKSKAIYSFGTWGKFLDKAGLRFSYEGLDDDELLNIMYNELKQIGSTTFQDYEKYKSDNAPSARHVIRKLGLTWNQLLEKIGSEVNMKRYEKEELLEMYINLCNNLGRAATIKDIDKYLPLSGGAFLVKFGNIDKLRESAGYPRKNHPKKYNKEIITSMLIDKYKEIGGPLTQENVSQLSGKENFPSLTTIFKYFGTTKIKEVWEEIEGIINEDGNN